MAARFRPGEKHRTYPQLGAPVAAHVSALGTEPTATGTWFRLTVTRRASDSLSSQRDAEQLRVHSFVSLRRMRSDISTAPYSMRSEGQ